MIEILKAVLFGIVEGITEWLPVSSTGHIILLDEFIRLNASEEFKKAVESNCDYIKNETLSVELVFDESLDKNLTLNDFEVGIEVNKN